MPSVRPIAVGVDLVARRGRVAAREADDHAERARKSLRRDRRSSSISKAARREEVPLRARPSGSSSVRTSRPPSCRRSVCFLSAPAPRHRSPGRYRSQRSKGSPIDNSSMAPPSILRASVGDVVLHAQHARGRAALAGAVEGRGDDIARPCSGRAEESTIIAFWPPVSAIRTAIGAVARGERAVDGMRGLRSSR